MRRAARTDANHAAIVRELRQCGLAVLDLSRVGQGCPDLLVASRRSDLQVLVEVKTAKGKLTPDELEFFEDWPGPLRIVARCAEDVLAWFEARE